MQSPTHCQRLREFVQTLPFDTGVGDLEHINVPITVLFAEQDKIIPPRYYGQQFVTEYPAIRTRIMPDVGHIPMLEAPDLVASEIRSSIEIRRNSRRRLNRPETQAAGNARPTIRIGHFTPSQA